MHIPLKCYPLIHLPMIHSLIKYSLIENIQLVDFLLKVLQLADFLLLQLLLVCLSLAHFPPDDSPLHFFVGKVEIAAFSAGTIRLFAIEFLKMMNSPFPHSLLPCLPMVNSLLDHFPLAHFLLK